jgi:hypothetical protein
VQAVVAISKAISLALPAPTPVSAFLCPQDAAFCAKFAELLNALCVPYFSTVWYYNQVRLKGSGFTRWEARGSAVQYIYIHQMYLNIYVYVYIHLIYIYTYV